MLSGTESSAGHFNTVKVPSIFVERFDAPVILEYSDDVQIDTFRGFGHCFDSVDVPCWATRVATRWRLAHYDVYVGWGTDACRCTRIRRRQDQGRVSYVSLFSPDAERPDLRAGDELVFVELKRIPGTHR